MIAACVLHNWCLIEDNEDTDDFGYVDELEMDGHIGIPTATIIEHMALDPTKGICLQ